jgi:hypothetical protein
MWIRLKSQEMLTEQSFGNSTLRAAKNQAVESDRGGRREEEPLFVDLTLLYLTTSHHHPTHLGLYPTYHLSFGMNSFTSTSCPNLIPLQVLSQ